MSQTNRNGHAILALTAMLVTPLMAQITTDFTATFTVNDAPAAGTYTRTLAGTGTVGTLGTAVLLLTRFQDLGPDYNSGVGSVGGALTIRFNRLDRITISNAGVQDPAAETVTVAGTVSSGTGAYAGATSAAGATSLTLTRTSTAPLRYNLTLTGTASVGGEMLHLAVTNVPVSEINANVTLFDSLTGTCAVPPLGNAALSGRSRPDTNRWDENVHFLEVNFTCTFSPTDRVQIFFTLDAKTGLPIIPFTIAGGTGGFAGAAGTATIVSLVENAAHSTTVTVSGSITLAGPATPVITGVNTAAALNAISENDWIEIKGTNLVPPDTPAGGMLWNDAPEFAQGKMPTQLGGVSVTVNGKPAYVYFFCSAATTPACASDQINVLTPLDDYLGQVAIVVKNGAASSGAFLSMKVPATPSILLFSALGDAVATHANGSLLGPLTLFPGASTPAARGETILLWGVGFGLPVTPLVAGSSTQRGALPFTPGCNLDGLPVPVASALVSPGLYQFNATIPDGAAAGENHFYCTYGATNTPGVLIAVQ